MSEIKRKPVFEKINDNWFLVATDCPLCDNGIMTRVGRMGDTEDSEFIEFFACDECHCVLSFHPYASSPGWRVLQ